MKCKQVRVEKLSDVMYNKFERITRWISQRQVSSVQQIQINQTIPTERKRKESLTQKKVNKMINERIGNTQYKT